MLRIKLLSAALAFTLLILSLSCHSPETEKNLTKSDISPGTAIIVGTITAIEPVSMDSGFEGPCSKAPCIALVKVNSASYGAGFPPLVMGKEIRIKFNFTLVKTTKELFPNLKEEYPGLEVGNRFTAIVSEIKSVDKNVPRFRIYGYEKI